MFYTAEYLQSTIFQDRRKLTLTSIICTLNFVFIILGYELIIGAASSVFSIEVFENSFITWYVRTIFLVFAMMSFFLGKSTNGKVDKLMMLFILLWIMYLCRAVHDLVFLTPLEYGRYAWATQHDSFSIFKTWSYIIVFTMLPLLSLYRSWEQIDFQRALDFIIIVGIFSCISPLFSVVSMGGALTGADVTNRVDANARMGTIALGHLGVSIFIASTFRFLYSNKISFWKLICIISALLGLLVTLRAGSRSPIVALIGVNVFWIGVILRNLFAMILSSSFLLLLVYLFREKLLDVIYVVSPVLSDRWRLTVEYGQGRSWSWDYVKNLFGYGFGSQLDLLGYTHNLFIDGFMMFGIMGWIFPAVFLSCVYRSYVILRERSYLGWVALLFLQSFIYTQFSICFGGNSFLQGTAFIIMLVFMKIQSVGERRVLFY